MDHITNQRTITNATAFIVNHNHSVSLQRAGRPHTGRKPTYTPPSTRTRSCLRALAEQYNHLNTHSEHDQRWAPSPSLSCAGRQKQPRVPHSNTALHGYTGSIFDQQWAPCCHVTIIITKRRLPLHQAYFTATGAQAHSLSSNMHRHSTIVITTRRLPLPLSAPSGATTLYGHNGALPVQQ